VSSVRLVCTGVVATAIVLAGCSSTKTSKIAETRASTPPAVNHSVGGGSPSAGGCSPDITARICLTASITGKVSVSGSAVTVAPEPPEADPSWTCVKLATFVNGDTDLGSSASGVGGHALQWDGTVPGFHGPGTYPLSGTEFYITVDGVGYSAVKSELLHSDPTASVNIDANFGVRITFTNLQGQTPADRISGALSWTCQDPE